MDALIINADDFGISVDVNEAVEFCFINSLINQTTLMVNMPSADDAVMRARKHNFMDFVGLHLNLVEGIPLTEDIKNTILCDSNGHFNGSIMDDKRNRVFLNLKTQNAVKKEIIAQINKYLQYGFTLKHLDSHQHAHTNPSIFRLLMPIASEMGITSIRLTRNIPTNSISGVKSIYKTVLNQRIRKFNVDSYRYVTITHFGSMSDYDLEYKNSLVSNCEVMTHPIMVENKIEEAFSDGSISDWMKSKVR